MPDNNYHYPEYAMLEKIEDTFRKAGSHAVHASAGKVVTVRTLLNQWESLLSKIPGPISRAARGITDPTYHPYGIGAVMLRSMGWKQGTSVGKRPGITAPIDTPAGTDKRAGLGNPAKNKHAAKKAARKAKFKVIRRDGELIYGTYQPATHLFYPHSLNQWYSTLCT